MTTIKELLKSYYLPGPFQVMKNDMLRRDLESASVDPCIRLITTLLKKDGNRFHPEEVVRILAAMGVSTEDELIDFYNFMISHGIEYEMDVLCPILDIDIESLEKICIQEFSNLVIEKTNVAPMLSDSFYYLVTDEVIKKLVSAIDFDEFAYEKESRDCDDFSALFRAKLSEAGLGNLTVGTIIASAFNADSEDPVFVHSFIIFFKPDGIVCYDPKHKFLGRIDEIMMKFKECDYAEIRSLTF